MADGIESLVGHIFIQRSTGDICTVVKVATIDADMTFRIMSLADNIKHAGFVFTDSNRFAHRFIEESCDDTGLTLESLGLVLQEKLK